MFFALLIGIQNFDLILTNLQYTLPGTWIKLSCECHWNFTASLMTMAVGTIFLKEAKNLGETTSLRGIPRIFKHFPRSRILFILWLLGVLTCFAVLLWQISLVFIRFFGYPVNTQYVQAPSTVLPTFPDITVCNACPLVH